MFASFYPPGQRDGSNSFTYTRFLIPFLQDYRGWAIFADGADMVCLADIAELWALRDEYKAVQIVQHEYKTKHPRKYLGTAMESENRDYRRKNWSSVMLINCASYGWRQMKPEKVAAMFGAELHSLDFLPVDRVGTLPAEWNWMPQEFGSNPDAKLIHWTAGIPGFPAYAQTEMADAWAAEAARVTHVTA
jgi:lipopolysaccharide biosynthesis glycosyltransferase